MENKNIFISGVGGQGVILASKVLCNMALNAGLDVKQSEVHGMAQRGGSVQSQVLFGEKVYSPLIKKNGADFLLAFELIESARYIDYLKEGHTVIVNKQIIVPTTVTSGLADYPSFEDVDAALKKKTGKIIYVDADKIAQKLGNMRVVNIILIGVLAKNFPEIEKEKWIEAIKTSVKPKFVELNMKAFEAGYSL